MTTKIVKWFSAFVILIMLAVTAPQTASAESSVSGTFSDRTFSVTRSTPGGPWTDGLAVDILPTQTGYWWVTAGTIAGSSVIVQVWRNDDGVLTLESSSRLRAVGEESMRTLLMAGLTYAATFMPFGKAGTSVLHERFMVSGEIVWIHQFGTEYESDFVYEVAVDDTGVYAAGQTEGTLPGQASAGGRDAFVRKYDPDGNEVWTRQFGTPLWDAAFGIAADASGVYVAGDTNGAFPGLTNEGPPDAFIRKYDPDGNEVWTRQFGTPLWDAAFGIAADASGVYVAGNTNGVLPGQTNEGMSDAFVRKYDPDGNEVWTRQFGTWQLDYGEAVAVDRTGVYVVGRTYGAFPGQTNAGDWDAFVRKYDFRGNEVWTRQFGTGSYDIPSAVAVGASGVYVVGHTRDAFVRKYDPDGNEVWTREFGTPLWDRAGGVAVDTSGVYVAGETDDALPGQASAGGRDAFVRKYDSDGNELWTSQFGSSNDEWAWPIAVGVSGLYMAGGTSEPDWEYATDVFVARLSP